jgi:GNAT superfamily N-acetyltransferase
VQRLPQNPDVERDRGGGLWHAREDACSGVGEDHLAGLKDAEDRPDIWPFCRTIITAGDTYAWDPELGQDAARERWMSPSARVFVVENSERIVASAYLKPNYGGPAARVANVGLMVDPACAGRGIGRRLAGLP